MCIIAFIALVDGLMTWWGQYLNIDQFTLEMILGYLLYPVSFLLGVSRKGDDIYRVAQLIGLKLIGTSWLSSLKSQSTTPACLASQRSLT
jgi:CNT family concentrative nucleoside transporter